MTRTSRPGPAAKEEGACTSTTIGSAAVRAGAAPLSLDELVGRKPVSAETRIRNHALNALWQQADMLPVQEQQALILVIDSFVKKAVVEKAMGKRSGDKPPSKLAA